MKTKKTLYQICLLLVCIHSSWSQTVFSENMGSPTTTTTIASNVFENNNSLSYSNGGQSNSADVRTTNASTGYGGASSGGNIFFSSISGAYGFSVEGINASNYTSLSLQFGYRKESSLGHALFSVDYWNGSTWVILANNETDLFNESASASAKWYLSKVLTLPVEAQINGLKIRFVKTGTTAIRIDDVLLTANETPTDIPSSSSDIVFNSSSSTSSNTNINYLNYQADVITSTANSVGVMGFYLRDGGVSLNDTDSLATELTEITFNVTNSANIRSARLFVGNSPRGVSVPVNGASTIAFTGLTNIIADDNDQLAINLRVTFNEVVTDNEQIQFTISSATAKSTGSQFSMANAGGASSSISGDINRIEVMASKLEFLQQPVSFAEKSNMIPSPSVQAVDFKGNRDLDFSETVSVISNGMLINSPQMVNAIEGLVVFNGINHDVSGLGIFLTANTVGLSNAISNSFNIFLVPKFDTPYTYVQNSDIPDLPTTSLNGVIGIWNPPINNMETTTYSFTPNVGQNAINTTLTIDVVASPFDNQETMAAFNQSCLVNGVMVNCVSEVRHNYISPNPSSNNFCNPPIIHSPVASSQTSDIVFTFSTPITSVRIPFYVLDNFQLWSNFFHKDKMRIIINSVGQLSYSDLCGLELDSYGSLRCNLPPKPPGVINTGNGGVTISSTIPFTTLTIDDQGHTSFSTHPCDLTDIAVCLAGTYAPNLNLSSLNNICPNTNINLTSISASNQPANAILTWHTTTPANGSSLVSNPNSVNAGTYYAAFYDAINNCYSPTSTAVTAVVNNCISDLSITKSVNNNNPAFNSNVTFTITATNNGPSPASGVTATDLLPSGYDFVGSSSSSGSWLSPNWNIGNLAVGETVTLSIIAKVGCGNYENTATITGNQTDVIVSNNSSTSTISPILTLNAVNDDFSNQSIFTCAGGQTQSVFNNDIFDCNIVNTSSVIVSLIDNGGIAGATIDNDGLITVPINTTPGTYFLTYKICKISNPTNCDTAIVKIVVHKTIDSVDDNFSSFPINTITGGNTNSVFDNDTLNGLAINPSEMTYSLVNPLSISGATINSLGYISVPPNTIPGTYSLTYQINQTSCPLNFDTANVIINVSDPFITTPNISNSIRANNLVEKIELLSTGKIIISGHFSTYNNVFKRYVARLNTDLTLDNSFTAAIATASIGSQQYFASLRDFGIQSDDKLIVVTDGPYSYGGSSAIARLDQNGNIDPTFVTGTGIGQTDTVEGGAYCNIEACAVQPDGKILIGGKFDTYNGTLVRTMIRLNPDGSIDPTFTFPFHGVSNSVNRIVVMPSGDILVSGAMFPTVPVEAMQRNLVKLDTYGNLDTTFTIGSTGLLSEFNPQSVCVGCSKFHILKILVQPSDGKILIAGAFNKYNNIPVNGIVRLETNGEIDPTFNDGASGSNRVIYDLDLETPSSNISNILFCGEFSTYNGASVKKMARMTYNGELDESFSIGTGTLNSGSGHNYIRALKRQSDGKIIVGGRFTSFNGITAGNITRIQGDNGLQARSSVTEYVSEPEKDIYLTFGSIKIYPNPSNGLFNIDLTEEEFDFNVISIHNLLGVSVYSSSIVSNEINQIDLSHLPSGYYIAKIASKDKSIQIKLVKK